MGDQSVLQCTVLDVLLDFDGVSVLYFNKTIKNKTLESVKDVSFFFHAYIITV